MAQQINLYNPILLTPLRHFSAAAMARALLVLLLLLAALCGWLGWRSTQLARQLEATESFQQAERQQLEKSLAGRKALPGDTGALQQEVAREQQALVALRARLEATQRGLVREGRSPAALLRLVAATVPAPVWLTEVQIDDGQLALRGMTLQPEALKPWVAAFAKHPLTAAQQLGVGRVERQTPDATLRGAVERWEFRIAPAQGTKLPAEARTGAPR